MSDLTPDQQDTHDMARLAGGADAALSHLMERHAQKLFHFLVRSLQNETDAADLAQETFVRIYQSRDKFDLRQKFTTWLYAIASNLVRGPDEQMQSAERAALVRKAIAALPEELRQPLILAVYQELSHAEIAAILDCSSKAVEMRIYRARQQLRTSLTELLEAP